MRNLTIIKKTIILLIFIVLSLNISSQNNPCNESSATLEETYSFIEKKLIGCGGRIGSSYDAFIDREDGGLFIAEIVAGDTSSFFYLNIRELDFKKTYMRKNILDTPIFYFYGDVLIENELGTYGSPIELRFFYCDDESANKFLKAMRHAKCLLGGSLEDKF